MCNFSPTSSKRTNSLFPSLPIQPEYRPVLKVIRKGCISSTWIQTCAQSYKKRLYFLTDKTWPYRLRLKVSRKCCLSQHSEQIIEGWLLLQECAGLYQQEVAKFLTKRLWSNSRPRPFRINRSREISTKWKSFLHKHKDFSQKSGWGQKSIYLSFNWYFHLQWKSQRYVLFLQKKCRKPAGRRNTSWFQSPSLKVQIPHGI